ncbi:MAG: phosphotransferase, partial [Planctomycetota bacterium]
GNGAAGWGAAGMDVVIEALVTFHEATVGLEPAGEGAGARGSGPPAGVTPRRSFAELLDRSRKTVSDGGLAEKQKWNALLKKAKKRIGGWQAAWDGRATDGWCHGDFHAGNVMSRSPAPDGPGVLIDFAQTRRGHWLEDAVYFEHQYWSVPEMLEGRQPTKMVVEGRRRLGLDLGHDWSDLAAALRAWFAISAPLTLGKTHGRAHLDAAMCRLERLAAGQVV